MMEVLPFIRARLSAHAVNSYILPIIELFVHGNILERQQGCAVVQW